MAFRDIVATAFEATKAAFGESITYIPQVGAPATITGVFEAAAELVSVGDEPGIASIAPILGIKLADLAVEPKRNDSLTIGSKTYKVSEVRPDEKGWALLVLFEQ